MNFFLQNLQEKVIKMTLGVKISIKFNLSTEKSCLNFEKKREIPQTGPRNLVPSSGVRDVTYVEHRMLAWQTTFV